MKDPSNTSNWSVGQRAIEIYSMLHTDAGRCRTPHTTTAYINFGQVGAR